jgi:hypothetical protein
MQGRDAWDGDPAHAVPRVAHSKSHLNLLEGENLFIYNQ